MAFASKVGEVNEGSATHLAAVIVSVFTSPWMRATT
ncbi:unannotated protein [freshwater metagenome]|uniref:Unannotated protein n=1 Tax=freshwater metagenome TaxID=449393 RepID=A0A6J6WJY6_9ZZZZ